MSEPLSATELDDLAAELSHPSLPATPGPGSNVAYVSKEENDRLVAAGLALGLGQFGRLRADDVHRLAAQLSRR